MSDKPTSFTSIHTSAPAKLILFGEHAVVYGKPALATSLNLRTHAYLRKAGMEALLGPTQHKQHHNSKFAKLYALFTGGAATSSEESAEAQTHIHLHLLGKLFNVPFSLVQSHFMTSWANGRLYLSQTRNTADSELVRLVEALVDELPDGCIMSKDVPLADDPHPASPLLGHTSSTSSTERNALICIFYAYFVGIYHYMKHQGLVQEEEVEEGTASSDSWMQHEKRSDQVEQAVSRMAFDLNVETELPVGAGLGSSASFCVAVASAFMLWFQEEFGVLSPGYNCNNLDDVNHLAYELECVIHGTPSGIDNTVSTFGGLIRMQGKHNFQHLKWEHEPLRVIIVNTKVPRNTKELVAGVRKRYEDPETSDLIEELMATIEHITDVFAGMSDTGFSRTRFQELIDKNQKALNKMGVGHKELDRVILLAKQYDLHGKLTGAGGGGCAFVYVPSNVSEDVVDEFLDDLTKANFWAREVDISTPGVQMDVEKVKVPIIVHKSKNSARKTSSKGAIDSAASGVSIPSTSSTPAAPESAPSSPAVSTPKASTPAASTPRASTPVASTPQVEQTQTISTASQRRSSSSSEPKRLSWVKVGMGFAVIAVGAFIGMRLYNEKRRR